MSKVSISICMGSSCFSRGNQKSLEIIKNYIQENDLDANINLTGCLCSEHCNEGPIITINEHTYRDVNPSTVRDILNHVIREDAS